VQAQQTPMPSESDEVVRFINAVQYVSIYKAQAKGFLSQAKAPINPDDAKFQSFMRRVTQIQGSALRPHFVKVMQKHISTSSALALAEFFESPVGRKIATASVIAAERVGDISSIRSQFQLTDQERIEAARFMQTSVYRNYAQLVVNHEFARELMQALSSAPDFADLNLNAF
jgi:hypothetical protein